MKAGFSLFSFTVFIVHASVFAMDCDHVIDMGESNPEVLYDAHHYVEAAKEGNYSALQKELDVLVNCGTDIPAAKNVFKSLYDYVVNECQTKASNQIIPEFAAIQHESYLKMAYRFAFAKEFKYDIDELKCCEFFEKAIISCFTENVTFDAANYNPLFLCGDHLEYSVPFLEYFFEHETQCLCLDGSYIKEYPKSLLLLDKLQSLMILPGKSVMSRLTYELRFTTHLLAKKLLPIPTLIATSIPQWLIEMPSLRLLLADFAYKGTFVERGDLQIKWYCPS